MHYWPQLTWEKILWGMSYTNLNMLLATIPKMKGMKTPTPPAAKEQDKVIMHDDLGSFIKKYNFK